MSNLRVMQMLEDVTEILNNSHMNKKQKLSNINAIVEPLMGFDRTLVFCEAIESAKVPNSITRNEVVDIVNAHVAKLRAAGKITK